MLIVGRTLSELVALLNPWSMEILTQVLREHLRNIKRSTVLYLSAILQEDRIDLDDLQILLELPLEQSGFHGNELDNLCEDIKLSLGAKRDKCRKDTTQTKALELASNQGLEENDARVLPLGGNDKVPPCARGHTEGGESISEGATADRDQLAADGVFDTEHTIEVLRPPPHVRLRRLEAAEETGNTMDIRCDGFSLELFGRLLLKETNLVIADGQKYGLVGKKGSGKSALLKQIATKKLSDAVSIPAGTRVILFKREVGTACFRR